MTEEQTSSTKPKITGAHVITDESQVTVTKEADEVSIIVTQLFGPSGDNLVGLSGVSFDGYPAFTLLVRAGDREGLVHLSPIHGDTRKTGMDDLPAGTKCELFCPVSKQPLDQVMEVPDNQDTDYYALYLTKQLSRGSHVSISNIWGHYHSRVVDNFELISSWMPEAPAS